MGHLACSWGHTLAISDNKRGPELKDASSPFLHSILTAPPWIQPKVSGPSVPLRESVFGWWPSRGLYSEAPTMHAGWKQRHPRTGSFISCHSVTKSCLTLSDPTDCSRIHGLQPASLSFTISCSLLKLIFIESVMPSNNLILLAIFPNIRVFSNELALCIRRPKYWSFSFSISSSNEYSGLISLGLTGLIFLLIKELPRMQLLSI